MANPAYVGSTSASGSGTTLVIPYSASAGDFLVLGTLDSGAGVVGISSITDNGENSWTVANQSFSQPGYSFNLSFVTLTNPITSITVTLTGSVSSILAILGEWSNFSPNVSNVVRDFHQAAISEQNNVSAGNALISFYVAYNGGAFTGPDIGGIQRRALGPGSPSPFTGSIALVDDMTTNGKTSETTASPSLSFSEFGYFAPITSPTRCTVTANLRDAADNPANPAFIRFRLRNFSGSVPRILGFWVLGETQADVFPDNTGFVSTPLWTNDNIETRGTVGATFYTVEFWSNGRITSQMNVFLACSGGTIDLDNLQLPSYILAGKTSGF